MVRLNAIQILHQLIIKKKSFTQLKLAFEKTPPQDRALLKEFCFGVSRWYLQLNFIAQQFINKPLKNKDFDIHLLIILGLYQLKFMRIPSYAALSETVEVARKLQKEWATKLINGVLRSYLKQNNVVEEKLLHNEVALFSHPQWFINKLKKNYDTWQKILEANNEHPLFCLRVNTQKISRNDYIHLLARHDLKAELIPHTEQGVVLSTSIDVKEIPGFEEGWISVQDGAAQLAAQLLDAQQGDNVLDACAAPGGKTCHILERQPQVKKLIALDNDQKRLALITENLNRLQLFAEVIEHSVTDLHWWDKKPFDRILLDAPCSATGVINRHPDIKILRDPNDVAKLCELQLTALNTIWQTLKPGGYLLYVTCSVLPEENWLIIDRFLATQADSYEHIMEAPWGIKEPHGRQILPGMHYGMDGFYFALLGKRKN